MSFGKRTENFFPVADKEHFNKIKFVVPAELPTVYQGGRRYYVVPTADEEVSQTRYMPSITTILGQQPKPALENWKKALGPEKAAAEGKRAANRGEGLHKTVERYILNEQYYGREATGGQEFLFNGIKRHLNLIDNVVALEVPLYSLFLGVAGRCDCIAEYDGVPSIIDFKTSKKPKRKEWISDYFMQAAFYSIAFEEMTSVKVSQLVIIIANEDGTSDVFIERRGDWIKPLWNTLRTYMPTIEFDENAQTVSEKS